MSAIVKAGLIPQLAGKENFEMLNYIDAQLQATKEQVQAVLDNDLALPRPTPDFLAHLDGVVESLPYDRLVILKPLYDAYTKQRDEDGGTGGKEAQTPDGGGD